MNKYGTYPCQECGECEVWLAAYETTQLGTTEKVVNYCKNVKHCPLVGKQVEPDAPSLTEETNNKLFQYIKNNLSVFSFKDFAKVRTSKFKMLGVDGGWLSVIVTVDTRGEFVYSVQFSEWPKDDELVLVCTHSYDDSYSSDEWSVRPTAYSTYKQMKEGEFDDPYCYGEEGSHQGGAGFSIDIVSLEEEELL